MADIKEKLVELIRNAKTAMRAENLSCDLARNMFVADFLIANGVTIQEWISVEERLPKVGSRVLACGEKGGVFLVKAEGETTGFGRMDGSSKYRSFTNWMPLPEPPKGE